MKCPFCKTGNLFIPRGTVIYAGNQPAHYQCDGCFGLVRPVIQKTATPSGGQPAESNPPPAAPALNVTPAVNR